MPESTVKTITIRYSIDEEALREHYSKILKETKGHRVPPEAELKIDFEDDEVSGISFVWEESEEL